MNDINSPTNNPGAQAAIAASNDRLANPLGKFGSPSLNAVDAAVHNYQPTIIVNNPGSNVDVAQASHDGFLKAFAQQRRERG